MEYMWLEMGEITLPPEAEGRGDRAQFKNLLWRDQFCLSTASFGTWPARSSCSITLSIDNISRRTASLARPTCLRRVITWSLTRKAPWRVAPTGPVIPGTYTDPFREIRPPWVTPWHLERRSLLKPNWMDVVTSDRGDVLPCRRAACGQPNRQGAGKVHPYRGTFEQPLEGRTAATKKGPPRGSERGPFRVNGQHSPTSTASATPIWTWPGCGPEETQRKASHLCAQLRLIEKYPGYKFLQSQPQTYAYCQQYYPELFQRIKQAIQQGGWIADTGRHGETTPPG